MGRADRYKYYYDIDYIVLNDIHNSIYDINGHIHHHIIYNDINGHHHNRTAY